MKDITNREIKDLCDKLEDEIYKYLDIDEFELIMKRIVSELCERYMPESERERDLKEQIGYECKDTHDA